MDIENKEGSKPWLWIILVLAIVIGFMLKVILVVNKEEDKESKEDRKYTTIIGDDENEEV